jgi:hypothetical protein
VEYKELTPTSTFREFGSQTIEYGLLIGSVPSSLMLFLQSTTGTPVIETVNYAADTNNHVSYWTYKLKQENPE